MPEIILPSNFTITRHATKRFLERIIGKESYTNEDEEVAIAVIRNIFNKRVLKTNRLDISHIQIKYRNALFVYDTDMQTIITVYSDDNSKDKVEWIIKFLPGLIFKNNIDSNYKLKLITQGFIPLRIEGRALIGRVATEIFYYDPKYNVIWLTEKNKPT